MRPAETHLSHRSRRLPAAVLGAGDGMVSTASLVLGIAAGESTTAIVTAGMRAPRARGDL